MKITVVVATHKKYRMPMDSCYLPVHVGKEGKASIGLVGDNTGDNISEKNPYYCELTGMYWAWKNVDSDYLGLVQYRRHFASPKKKSKDRMERILGGAEMKRLLRKHDIIVPKKRHYYIETLYSHYAHTHYAAHLDITREIIRKQYPEYLASFDRVMKRRSAHMFNMYIMSRRKNDEYCQWLFDILSELEKKVDVTQYDGFQARLFGRVSELLLDVWLDQKQYAYCEVPIVNIENLDWKRKINSFIFAKLFGKKYGESF